MKNFNNQKELESTHNISEISEDISDMKFYDIPILIIFFILFCIVTLQFLTRYVFNFSFGWTEEMARYLLIVLSFLGGVICVKKNSHIFLEFIYTYLSPRSVKALLMFSESLLSAFFIYCGWLAIELSKRTVNNMVSIDLPKSVIYYFVSFGCFSMGLLAIIHLIKNLKKSSEEVIREKLASNIEEV